MNNKEFPKRRTSDTPKPSMTIKRLWKAAKTSLSLHEFAKSIKDKEPAAKEWLANRAGAKEKKEAEARQKNKGTRLAAERAASKVAHRK
jgi:hypothetical protein